MLSKNLNIDKYIVEIEPMERIGGVFAKNRITLIHGVQGSGKSFSTIKAINEDSIVPIHINLDESTGLEGLETYNVGDDFMKDFLTAKFDRDSFKNQVVVIDTYTRFEQIIYSYGKIKDSDGIFIFLEDVLSHYEDITIIVVGHTQPFVSVGGIFNDNLPLVRGCAEELWLEKQNFKATKKEPAYSKYTLHVCKGRGYNGNRAIVEWMREDT